ncbi:MAG: hypothetical protein WD336_10735 [Trueperaceae bacterium]
MAWVVAVLSFVYAVTNTFGAWTVVRRRPRLAATFMLAAASLTVGGVGVMYGLMESTWIVAAGAVLGSAASYGNARIVLHRTVLPNHLGRAAIGALLTVAAWVLVRPPG